MYILVIAIIVGIIIGALTNSLAIKMLFRPFKPWKVGNWQLPFTPGLIPKRRYEIAESMGHLVENYLFTAKGLKQFIEKSGIEKQLYLKLSNKLTAYYEKNKTIGDLLTSFINEDWKIELQKYSGEKLVKLIDNENLKGKNLEELLAEETINKIEHKLLLFSPIIIKEIKIYLKSIEGRRWLDSLIKQSLEGNKALGFFAGMLLDGGQFQDKIVAYLEQILDSEKTENAINSIIIKEWNKIKQEPITTYLNDFKASILVEANHLINKGTNAFANMTVGQAIAILENRNIIEKIYKQVVNYFIERLESVFSYFSISKVVKEEVDQFSLEVLEKIIIGIAGRELRMITYFGGIIGGLIGFFQGMLYLFF